MLQKIIAFMDHSFLFCDLEMPYCALHIALLEFRQLLRIVTDPSISEWIQESLYAINHTLFLENE